MSRPILLYLAVYDPGTPLTGTGVRGHQFVKHFAAHFDLEIIHMEGSGQAPVEGMDRSFPDTLPGLLRRQAVPFRKVGYFLWSRRLLDNAREVLREKKVALIFCDYGLSGLYGQILSREFQVPWIYSSHNLEHKLYLQKAKTDFRRWILFPWVFFVERRSVREADRVLAISEKEGSYYAKWTSPDRIRIIPQGFDVTKFHPPAGSKPPHTPTILFCGNFNINFNREVAHFIRKELIEEVVKVFPDAKFQLIGANPPHLEAHPALELTGFVENYPERLRGADLVISPMNGGSGFPTKIVEALACGKTVLATPVGARGLKTDLKQLIVVERSEFKNKLIELLQNQDQFELDDFEKIRRHYSWSALIEPFCKDIKTTLLKGQ